MIHELPAAIADMTVLPGVLGCRLLVPLIFGNLPLETLAFLL
jgi:hypothetical protein